LTFFPREQAFIEAGNVNIAEFSTTGVDLQILYSLDLGSLGDISFNYNATFLDSIDQVTLPDTPAFDCAGFYGQGCGNPNPEYRHNFVTTWNAPYDITASLVWRYFCATELAGTINNGFGQDGTITSAFDDGNPNIADTISAISYLDLTVFHQLTDSIRLRAGVNNLLDEDPPIVTTFGAPAAGTNVEANTIAGVFDAGGRFIFFGASVTF
jgi:outer membrane receptor protein involved in Fe transport